MDFTFTADTATCHRIAQEAAWSIPGTERGNRPTPGVDATAGILGARRRTQVNPGNSSKSAAPPTTVIDPASVESELDAMVVAQVDAMLSAARATKSLCTAKQSVQRCTSSFAPQSKIDLSPIPFDDEVDANLEADIYAITQGITLEPLPARYRARA